MSVSLPPEIVDGLASRARPDGYRTATEVLAACLAAIEEREGRVDVRISYLQDEIAESLGPDPRPDKLALSPKLAALLTEKTAAYGHASPATLVDYGLRLLDREAERWEVIGPMVMQAMEELDRGEGLSKEEVIAHLRAVRKGVRL